MRRRQNEMRRIDFDRLSAWKPGNQGPSTVLKVQGKYIDAGSGSGDDIAVFKDGGDVYVLSLNRGIPYIGLSRFSLSEGDETKTYRYYGRRITAYDEIEVHSWANEIFAQGDSDVEGVYGRNWGELSTEELVERGAEHLY